MVGGEYLDKKIPDCNYRRYSVDQYTNKEYIYYRKNDQVCFVGESLEYQVINTISNKISQCVHDQVVCCKATNQGAKLYYLKG